MRTPVSTRVWRFVRAGGASPDPANVVRRAQSFAVAASESGTVTLVCVRDDRGMAGYLVTSDGSSADQAALHLAQTVAARAEPVAELPGLDGVGSVGWLRAHPTSVASRDVQTRAEAAQQTAETASAEAQATAEQVRTELAELRQQHRAELDTLRAENRAERDQLRAEHREQLADLRTLARTAEQRADEHRDRADRAEAIIATRSRSAVGDEPLREQPGRDEGGT